MTLIFSLKDAVLQISAEQQLTVFAAMQYSCQVLQLWSLQALIAAGSQILDSEQEVHEE